MTSPPRPIKFLIIGAGPGGISAASSIRRHLQTLAPFDGSNPALPRVEFELFEQKIHVGEHVGVQYSVALGNKPRWDSVFGPGGMGIAHAVDPAVVALSQVRYVHGSGEEIWSRTIPAGSDEGRYIGQVKRAGLLESMVASLPKGAVQFRKTVRGWRQWEEDGGGVEVTFEDGEVRRGDYIIAADGVFSQFRLHYLPTSTPVVTDIGSIYLLARVPPAATDELSCKLRDMSNNGVSLTSLAKDSCAGFFPLRNGEFCIFVEVRKSWEASNLPAGKTLEDMPFTKLVEIGRQCALAEHAAYPELAKGLDYSVNTGQPVWRLKYLPPIPHALFGRVLLLGDAAHAIMPYLGRGAVTAIEDGAILGSYIARGLQNREPVGQILGQFEKERLPAWKGICELALTEVENWWEIGAGRRDGGELVLAKMDRSRRAKQGKGEKREARM